MAQEIPLGEVAEALNTLARYGLLYGGFKRKLRKVVEVRATTQLVVRYDDGGLYYIDPSLRRRFIVYTRPPQQ